MTSGQRFGGGLWFGVFYAACIIAMSLATMTHAPRLSDHRAWLPAIEIIGAALLIVGRTRLAGLVILLAVYAVVAVHSVHTGGVPLDLILFAGTAVFVAQLRAPGDSGRS